MKTNNFNWSFLKHTYVVLFVASLALMLSGCSKELKAGDPISVTYSQVFMIGNATSAQWDIGSAISMTINASNDKEFSWTGQLTAGEIKFPTARSWSADTFMSFENGQSISNNKALLTLSGTPDQKWLLSETDAGNYTITLNTEQQTVQFQKQ